MPKGQHDSPRGRTSLTGDRSGESPIISFRVKGETLTYLQREMGRRGLESLSKTVRALLRDSLFKSTQEESVCYLVSTRQGFVKIGQTNNLTRRLSQLQTANPEPLTLLLVLRGGADTERALHQRFAQHRTRGEWFDLDIEHIGEAASGFEVVPVAPLIVG